LTGPTRARVQFGNRLRRLREQAGLNGKELAERLGWAPSKVSRIETGQRGASSDDIAAWALAVGASPEVTAELLEAHHVVRVEYDRFAVRMRGGHSGRQRAAVGLEAATSVMRVFEPDAIPGLLQTAEYARHILTSMTQLRQTPNDVEEAVRLRLRRQAVLYEPDKRFRILLTEAALRHHYAPPAVMRGQLDRLLTLAGLDTIELAVIPFGPALPVVLHHGFWVYDDHLVLVETFSAELQLRDTEDVALYTKVFETLWAVADNNRSAASLVQRVVDKL
jgi:transcriptional regulator with XRE-family HTH domain